MHGMLGTGRKYRYLSQNESILFQPNPTPHPLPPQNVRKCWHLHAYTTHITSVSMLLLPWTRFNVFWNEIGQLTVHQGIQRDNNNIQSDSATTRHKTDKDIETLSLPSWKVSGSRMSQYPCQFFEFFILTMAPSPIRDKLMRRWDCGLNSWKVIYITLNFTSMGEGERCSFVPCCRTIWLYIIIIISLNTLVDC